MGIAVPIALAIRSERREDRKEKEKEREQSEQSRSFTALPSVYISPGITVAAGTQVAQVTKVIVEFRLLNDGGKKGYSSQNLKTIKLVSSVKATQDI